MNNDKQAEPKINNIDKWIDKLKNWLNKFTFQSLSGMILLIIGVLILAFVADTFGKYGVLGFFLAVIVIASWRLWIARYQLILAMRYIEGMIWGKPLDKDMWKKNELKDKKVKIKW